MCKLLISVKDSKAESWSVPAASDNKATALRDFGSLVADGRTLVGQHPSDFDLYVVGTFDLITGLVESRIPEHLANGSDFVKKEST